MGDNCKKLMKSRYNRMLCGVCGGLGDYLGIDPTVVRLLWIIISVASVGSGFIAYLIAAVVIPEE